MVAWFESLITERKGHDSVLEFEDEDENDFGLPVLILISDPSDASLAQPNFDASVFLATVLLVVGGNRYSIAVSVY